MSPIRTWALWCATVAIVVFSVGSLCEGAAAADPAGSEVGYRHGLPPNIPVPEWAKGQRVQFYPWDTAKTKRSSGHPGEPGPPKGPEQGLGACAGCGTPPLTYYGGKVQHIPHIYAIFWGSSWNSEPGLAVKTAVTKMYEGLSESSYQGILTQYFDKTGRIGSKVEVTTYVDSKNPLPETIGDTRINEETGRAIEEHGLSHDIENQFVILTGPGSSYSFSGYCAFHGYVAVDASKIKVSRAWVPYEGDPPLREHCPGGAVAATSEAASHEFAESATDPEVSPSRGWFSADNAGEISDMCGYGPHELPSGSFVTFQWDDFQESCSFEDANPPHVLAFREPPTEVREREATLHAKVFPENLETTVKFEYGTTTGYGSISSSTVVKAGENLASSQAVSTKLLGLLPEQTYHFRVTATNGSGTYHGPDQTLTTSRWTMDVESPGANLSDISCVSAGNCVAVGHLVGQGLKALHWDGSKWAVMSTPIPPGSEESELSDVSCGSPSSCVATGFSEAELGGGIVAETWDGSKWSIANPVTPPAAVPLTTVIKDLSCVSATYCLAVGSYSTEGSPAKKLSTLVERWNGTEWTIEESANAEGQNLSTLEGVSCWGAASCLLVGNSKNTSSETTTQPLVESRLGGKWVAQAAPTAPGGSGKVISVSCRNAGFCMALGRDGTEAGFTASWNGSSWKEQSSGLAKGMRGLSCGAMNSCDIVGGASDSSATTGLAYHWNGSNWLAEAPAPPTTGSGLFKLNDISCLSDDFCKAAGDIIETLPTWWNYPTFSFASGSKGTGNGQFTNPWGITVDPSGNVWVTDSGNNRVQKFNSKGEYQCQIGVKGSGNGQFSNPLGLAADASGNVWVADSGNNRVQEVSSECKYLTQFGKSGTGEAQFSVPSGVAVDSAGNIWVLDSGHSQIQKFNSKGEYLTRCGSYGTGNGQLGEEAYGIAADTDGDVWVADAENARLEKFSPGCEYQAKITQASSGSPWSVAPWGLAIDPAGTIWAPSFANAVAGFYPEGVYVARFGESGSGNGQFGGPLGIASAADGTIWVVDRTNNRIEKWSAGTPNPVETGSATSIKTNEAKLTAMVNPEEKGTAYQFEYGTTPSYGSYVPLPSPKSVGSGTKPVSVSETLGGLKAATTYYYRVTTFTEGSPPSNLQYGKPRKFTTRDVEAKTAPALSQATPFQGVPETTTNGAWTGEASSYAYQWQRCNAEGKECVNITGATASSYTPVEADNGKALISRVTAIGPTGATAVAVSSPSGKVLPSGEKTEYSLPTGSGPWGIAAGPDGNLWFTNATSAKIGKITTGGAVTEYALPAASDPRGIVSGPDGNLWFGEDAANKIGKITPTGTKTEYSLPVGSHPLEIASGPDGNLWFTDTGTAKVGKITTSGTVTEYALEAGTQPWGITTGPDGNLWFTDVAKDRIGKITVSGTVSTYVLPAGSDPQDITAGPDGKLWFADTGTSKIGKITTSGTVTEYAAGSEAEFIAAGPDGNLWFTSFPEKFSKITTSGTVSSFALPASSFPGEIVAGPDNRMWFPLDSANNKIAAIVP